MTTSTVGTLTVASVETIACRRCNSDIEVGDKYYLLNRSVHRIERLVLSNASFRFTRLYSCGCGGSCPPVFCTDDDARNGFAESASQYADRVVRNTTIEPQWVTVNEAIPFCADCYESFLADSACYVGQRLNDTDDCAPIAYGDTFDESSLSAEGVTTRLALALTDTEQGRILCYYAYIGLIKGFSDESRLEHLTVNPRSRFTPDYSRDEEIWLNEPNLDWASFVPSAELVEVIVQRLYATHSLGSGSLSRSRRWAFREFLSPSEGRGSCILHESYRECDDCGEYVEDYAVVEGGWSNQTYCNTCVNDHAAYCDECDQWETYDNHCEPDSGIIASYGYKPEPIFHWLTADKKAFNTTSNYSFSDNRLFMGIELEMEATRGAYAADLAQIAKDHLDGFAYYKHDGSLRDGVELVTHPATLEAFKFMDWSCLAKIAEAGGRSWNTTTCGLHIHLSRSAFSGVTHLWLFSQFFSENRQQLVTLAGRESSYASFGIELKKDIKLASKKRRGTARYLAVNFTNNTTIELRLFRGSLLKERVFAQVELTDAIFNYTSELNSNKVLANSKTWKDATTVGVLGWAAFTQYCLDRKEVYPNLCNYLETLLLLPSNNPTIPGDDF